MRGEVRNDFPSLGHNSLGTVQELPLAFRDLQLGQTINGLLINEERVGRIRPHQDD